MTTGDPRSSRAWRKLRDQVVQEEPLCQLAYPTICTRVSTTADHIIAVTIRPDLALDRANVRGACHPCNLHRGQGTRPPTPQVGQNAAQRPALAFFEKNATDDPRLASNTPADADSTA